MQKTDLEILPAEPSDKPILRNMMQLYLYEFSEYDQVDVNKEGLYSYKYLDHYWVEPNRYPFIIRVKDQLAGFVLIIQHADPVHNQERWEVAEFFILKKYRRHGIGTQVAMHIFEMFRGKWQIAQIEDNLPAQAFWRKVIAEYTSGIFEEVTVKNVHLGGIMMYFDNTLMEDK